MVQTVNPATEEKLETFEYLKNSEIERRLSLSHRTFSVWSGLAVKERQKSFIALADAIEKNRDELSNSITREMGKPITEARAEVVKCAAAIRFYAERDLDWFQTQVMNSNFPRAEVVPCPLGVILGIMPWNFPLWQVIRFAIPTMLMGNTVMIKHAPNTFGTARLLALIFKEANFLDGAYIDLPCDVTAVPGLLKDQRVAGVSLTGSTRAGRAVGALAGENLKKCVLELGGSDAYVVLEDAPIDLAIKAIVQGRLQNAGQSCVAAKRAIVLKKNYQIVLDGLVDHFKMFEPLDPMDPKSRLGPLARRDLRDQLVAQVSALKAEGAQFVAGGDIVQGRGFYFAPTILTGLNTKSSVYKEELFGPVLTVFCVENEDEAFALANQTTYGLGGAIFSKDLERARNLATTKMRTGMVAINGMIRSDPRWPFGGVGDSGLGRELTQFGAHEFVNMKTLIIDGV